ELTARFAALGAKVTEMDATEKLRVLHDFYRSGEEVYFRFDAQDMMRKGHDFRDYICPDSIEKHSDYLMLGDKYARVIYLKDYASFISDQLVTKLTDQSRSMMLSIDIIPVATDEAVREVERKMLGVETNITNWQRRQNANNNFSAIVPYDMEQQRRETKEYMADLTSRDQRMLLSVLTIVHFADSKAELDADTDALLKVAADHMCQMAVLRYQQLDGLNTALPIGTRKIDTFRTLTTESLAVFMPFKVQEIQEPGGIYFGENAISHNLILCNMNNLLNQSMMLLGIPGSGKSFFAKLLIIAIALSTDDDIIILDPEGEYTPLVKALGGAVMCFAVGGSDWLNAMAMEEGYGEGSPVAFKSQFIMSLLKQIDPDGIRAHHKSIIDRCVALVLQDQKKTGKVPTLCTLREKLLEQPEQEARDLALTMELYTSGSLNIFAHETNVDTKNRIQSYDIHDLGEELKQPGFVTITDAMINRVNYNWAHGKKTHIFVDEFHIAYENEYSGNFFTSAWRQFRKRNAAPCAITQNVEYMLDSVQASTMVSNSEFVVMLNQAESDQERLSRLLNISPEQMSYVNGAEAGCGLMRYGNALVPFVNRFPADTELYKLITTKPGEGLFAKGQVDFHA
ncbi:MAG: VirB4-like conjugal transfer ATPase, CD1110 family, partial [Faecousia sp.]